MSDANKLKKLLEIEGFPSLEDFLTERGSDDVIPGICMNPDCNHTTDVEPDCTRGWCEECDEKTIKSALVLAGLI